MLSFLSPLALIGLAALAVPITIHLFKPKRVRVVPFSSLRWLRESQQRLSKRVQWHQLLLFLLRAAILALLVLAAARPILLRRGGSRAAHRIVVIDASRAMGYDAVRGPNALMRAKSAAVDLLADAGVGDLSTVCVVGDAARALGPLTPDPSVFLDPIAKLNVEAGERPVTDVLRLIPLLRRGHPRPELVELFFLTANLDASWRQSDIRDFTRASDVPIRVTVMTMADADLQNAWIVTADLLQGAMPQTQVLRVQVLANDAQITRRTLRLSGVKGIPDAEREVQLEAGRPTWVSFDLPTPPDAASRTGLLTLTPADALADDNRYWVDLAPRSRQSVLLIEAETTQVRELQAGFHLRTALETLAESTPGRFLLDSRTPEALQESDVLRADWIFWVDPRPIAAQTLDAIKNRIGSGAGLALFLGPTTDFGYCNEALSAGSPGDALLTRRIDGTVTAAQGQPRVKLTGIDWTHPLLSPFADPVYGDLARASFNAYAKLQPAGVDRHDRLLATFPDGTPALLEADYGAGRVLVVNTSANDTWSDFPRFRGFLPWVDGLLVHLNSGAHGRRLSVGDAAYLIMGDIQSGRPVELRGPDGKPVNVSLDRQAGRQVLQSAPLNRAGIYTLRYTSGQGEAVEMPVIVQVGRTQSRLSPSHAEVLEAWWEPSAFSVVIPDSVSRGHTGGALRNSLELLFLALAIALFFIETIWANMLCPRSNPKIESASAITKRGFFQGPLETSARTDAAGGHS